MVGQAQVPDNISRNTGHGIGQQSEDDLEEDTDQQCQPVSDDLVARYAAGKETDGDIGGADKYQPDVA